MRTKQHQLILSQSRDTIGIPTAIRRLIASHVAHTFHEKFARHMLPFNYAIGTPNGTHLIINAMQLQVEKNISFPQLTGIPPSLRLSSLT